MLELESLRQVREIFKDKSITDFLDDAYSYSQSRGTREQYKQVLYFFNRFCVSKYNKNLLEVVGSLRQKPLAEILDLFLQYKRYMDAHINYRGNHMSNSTKRVYLSILKNFFRSYGIKIHHEDIRDHVKIGRRMRVQKYALDPQTVSKIISKMPSFHFKALTVMLASTGMRVMEAITLRRSDFEFNSYPVKVELRPKETKTNEGRTVFLTKECADMVEQLIKTSSESQKSLFGKASPRQIYQTYSKAVRKILRDLGLYKILDNGLSQITIHSFRSFFRTYAGHVIDRDFAESFIGHRFYLSEYQNTPEEERKNLFLKLEPHITFTHVQVRKVTNPEIISLQKQMGDLQNKILLLGQKFLSEGPTF